MQIQPSYSAWSQVMPSMTKDQVLRLLGPPLRRAIGVTFDTSGGSWLYGFVEVPGLRPLLTYSFIVEFDAAGLVTRIRDPYGGQIRGDTLLPSVPSMYAPQPRQVFAHFPRIVDYRWSPCWGESPIHYELEVFGASGNDWSSVSGVAVDSPHSVQVLPGAGRYRARLRSVNRHGESEWAPWREFESSV